MVTLVVVNTSEMMDQDEEVVLELSNWIGGNKGALSLSVVISLSTGGGEELFAVSILFVEMHHWKECWMHVFLEFFCRPVFPA